MPSPTSLQHLATGRGDALFLWASAARAKQVPQLLPWDELIAEHRLAEAALVAMEEEIRRLYSRAVLDTRFWLGIVEIIDRFVHRNHRLKEEQFFFPALARMGSAEDRSAVEEFRTQHARAHDLTDEVVAGIIEGDWEKVLRAGMMYVSGIRKHMNAEEERLGHIAAHTMRADRVQAIRDGFAEVEAQAFEGRSRAHFIDVVLQLCQHTGVDAPPELLE